jgi:hypothetical protein
MAEYTWSPVATFEGRQINTQADADAWIASLTDNELRNEHDQIEIRDLVVLVEPDRILMTFIRADSLDAMSNRFEAPVGGYALASKTSIVLLLEEESNFHQRFQPFNGLA